MSFRKKNPLIIFLKNQSKKYKYILIDEYLNFNLFRY